MERAPQVAEAPPGLTDRTALLQSRARSFHFLNIAASYRSTDAGTVVWSAAWWRVPAPLPEQALVMPLIACVLPVRRETQDPGRSRDDQAVLGVAQCASPRVLLRRLVMRPNLERKALILMQTLSRDQFNNGGHREGAS
jgi:hypothetical protein